MNILSLVGQCNDPVMLYVLGIFKRILSVIQLAGPIVGIVAIILNLIKLMSSPDDKKNQKLIINWLIAIIMLFWLPTVINIVMSLLDNSFKISSCWNNALIFFKL